MEEDRRKTPHLFIVVCLQDSHDQLLNVLELVRWILVEIEMAYNCFFVYCVFGLYCLCYGVFAVSLGLFSEGCPAD